MSFWAVAQTHLFRLLACSSYTHTHKSHTFCLFCFQGDAKTSALSKQLHNQEEKPIGEFESGSFEGGKEWREGLINCAIMCQNETTEQPHTQKTEV